MPLFTVVLATRNRPGPFAQALQSVLRQTNADFDLIVVDDGSDETCWRRYEDELDTANRRLAGRVGVCRLPCRPRGHGPGYARNTGASLATGEYLCFLDDDDLWTDTGHLARAAVALGADADLYMANQVSHRAGATEFEPGWIAGLAALIPQGHAPTPGDTLPVTVEDLMRLGAFPHLNTLIVRRSLYNDAGGMDEGLRWEEDLDLFLRLIDRAGLMLHHPAVVAQHNVPDPTLGASATTSLREVERWLFRLRAMDKAVLFARHPAIRAHGRLHKTFTLKRIAELLRSEGRWTEAAYYAREALGAGPTLKWLAFTAMCAGMALFRPGLSRMTSGL